MENGKEILSSLVFSFECLISNKKLKIFYYSFEQSENEGCRRQELITNKFFEEKFMSEKAIKVEKFLLFI